MIRGLSDLIAYVLAGLLMLLLYPIIFIAWCLGRMGKVVCIISDWIFVHANNAIAKLMSELKSSEK